MLFPAFGTSKYLADPVDLLHIYPATDKQSIQLGSPRAALPLYLGTYIVYYAHKLKSSCKRLLTKIKDIYEMVQTCRVLHSRKQWKRKAIKRGAENRELRKTLSRKNEQIDHLKSGLSSETESHYATSTPEPPNTGAVKKIPK